MVTNHGVRKLSSNQAGIFKRFINYLTPENNKNKSTIHCLKLYLYCHRMIIHQTFLSTTIIYSAGIPSSASVHFDGSG